MEACAPSAQWHRAAYAKPQNDLTLANWSLNPDKHARPHLPAASRVAFASHLPPAARRLRGCCSLRRQWRGLDTDRPIPLNNGKQPCSCLRRTDAVAGTAAAVSASAIQERSSRDARLQDTGENGHASWDGEKIYDVVTLGNLCVDVLVEVAELPPADRDGKWEYLQRVRANPPGEVRGRTSKVCVRYRLSEYTCSFTRTLASLLYTIKKGQFRPGRAFEPVCLTCVWMKRWRNQSWDESCVTFCRKHGRREETSTSPSPPLGWAWNAPRLVTWHGIRLDCSLSGCWERRGCSS